MAKAKSVSKFMSTSLREAAKRSNSWFWIALGRVIAQDYSVGFSRDATSLFVNIDNYYNDSNIKHQ